MNISFACFCGASHPSFADIVLHWRSHHPQKVHAEHIAAPSGVDRKAYPKWWRRTHPEVKEAVK